MPDLIHDPVTCKLGKRKVRHDMRTLKLESYLPVILPPKPSILRSNLVQDWGMMLNDKYGDCTAAGWAHLHLLRTTLWGAPERMTDAEVEELYIDITGVEGAAFDPATGANDNGCAELDVMKYLQQKGHIGAYAAMAPGNRDHMKFCIDAFEGVYVGIELPTTAQNEGVWADLTGDPGSWGGHCVILVDYNIDGATCITWGGTKTMTWGWFEKYGGAAVGGEAYAILSNDLVTGDKQAPSGFDMDHLKADLEAVTAG